MDRHEEARLARAERIATEIARLRAAGGAARDLHTSKIEPLAERLSHEVGDDFTPAILAGRISKLIEIHPLLMSARTSGGVEKQPLYTTKDYRAMDPVKRLEVANEMDHAEREAEAAANAKTKTDFTPEQIKSMSPSRRLELANELSRFDKAVTKRTPTIEQLRRMDAARKLDEANILFAETQRAPETPQQRLARAMAGGTLSSEVEGAQVRIKMAREDSE